MSMESTKFGKCVHCNISINLKIRFETPDVEYNIVTS